MSDIFYTVQENRFRNELREYLEKELTPVAEDIEKRVVDPWTVLRKIGKQGYLGSLHPKKHSGQERGVMYEAIVAEEIAAINAATEMARAASCTLFGFPVREFGTEEQKERYLKPVAQGEAVGALGITEPNAGSDVAGIQTEAVLEGDFYILNGEKRFITNGSVADYILTYAVTDPNVHPHKGLTAFIVETKTRGFSVIKDFELMGMSGVHNSHLRFENMKIPKENVLGKVNDGFSVMLAGLDCERTVISGEMLGIARASLDLAVKYSSERVQFKRPIKEFEGISFKIADMAAKVEAARLLIIQAARLVDKGVRATKNVAIAKLYTCDIAVEVANDALQILGGIGYTKEYPVERYLRDARLMMIGAGTAEIMRYIIQREIFKEYGLT